MTTPLVSVVDLTPVMIALPGLGYIAGEAPTLSVPADGRVTLDNVPGIAEVNLLLRAGLVWQARQFSHSDGTYRFDGLPLNTEYDVIGRAPSGTWDDVIVGRVKPYAPPQITTTALAFALGNPAVVQMQAQYGATPLAWAADTAPPGLVLAADGAWSGIPTSSGTTTVTATVTDAYGETATRTYVATVT